MTAFERPVRHETGQRIAMVSQPTRRISEDVASLDSWTDVLNLSSSSDSSFHFVTHEDNRVSGSGFSSRHSTVNMDPSRYYVPRFERSVSLQTDSDSRNYNVTDGTGLGPRNIDHQHSHGVHINPNRLRTNHAHYTETHSSRAPSSWLNSIAQSNTASSSVGHNRPHALSISQYDTGNIHRFGISAQSRLGLPQTNIPNVNKPNVSRNDRGQQRVSSHRDDFEPDNLVDQLDRESERIKTKFLSAWNNVKYGWTLKTKTSFKCDSPIFLLGKCYHRKPTTDENDSNPRPHVRISNLDEFNQDFSSRMWFTYRREFSALPGTKLTTDCGWGCMLRSGQMLLAQGLVTHFLGRDWGVYHEPKPEEKAYYKEIIRWFADHMSDQIPFSIHKLVEVGQKHGKFPGDWYGPASVSLILRDAVLKAHCRIPVLRDVLVYVAQDCTVYKQDVIDLCLTRPKSNSQLSSSGETEEPVVSDKTEWKQSVIILIPMRLGGESLNPIYIPCVQGLLAHDNCIGIIGGKPKHSLYFVGWQDDKLINLDPHYCQDVVDTTAHDFPVQSFHCVSPRKLSFSKMDPSCTVGFYIRSQAEFNKFVHSVNELVIPPRQKGLYPLFIFSEGRGCDVNVDQSSHREQGRLRIRHCRVDREGNIRSPTMESEDFVIL